MNPYMVLGVDPSADDAAIRAAWLAAIQQATPESDPARFKIVNAAYHKIRDADSRARHELLEIEPPGESPLDVAARHVLWAGPPRPVSHEELKKHLRACKVS